jgi:hypothetical protein
MKQFRPSKHTLLNPIWTGKTIAAAIVLRDRKHLSNLILPKLLWPVANHFSDYLVMPQTSQPSDS